MVHILLKNARIVLRVMESGGVMENANGAMINAKPINMDLVIVMNLMKIVGAHICRIPAMTVVIIVVKRIMIVGNHVCRITNFTEKSECLRTLGRQGVFHSH